MTPPARVFRFAPMSGVFWAITIPLLLLAPLFLILSRWSPPLFVAGLLLVVVYAGVWLTMRPRELRLDESALEIRFPLRRWTIKRAEIASARVLTRAELKGELGPGVRVGVGGLFGTFGLLWTRKHSWVSCYVSRIDGLVLIERRGVRPLVVSPEAPHELARLLRG
jgi:Bacterial PH domain